LRDSTPAPVKVALLLRPRNPFAPPPPVTLIAPLFDMRLPNTLRVAPSSTLSVSNEPIVRFAVSPVAPSPRSTMLGVPLVPFVTNAFVALFGTPLLQLAEVEKSPLPRSPSSSCAGPQLKETASEGAKRIDEGHLRRVKISSYSRL